MHVGPGEEAGGGPGAHWSAILATTATQRALAHGLKEKEKAKRYKQTKTVECDGGHLT